MFNYYSHLKKSKDQEAREKTEMKEKKIQEKRKSK